MIPRLQLPIEAPRYALALTALWRARNCWHKLDAELVQAQQTLPDDPHLAELWRLLAIMDRHLARATVMLSEARTYQQPYSG